MKKVIYTILCIFIFTILFIGCMETKPNRLAFRDFTIIDSSSDGDYAYRILRHDETGVYYLQIYSGYHCGLSVMLNADGTPYTGK